MRNKNVITATALGCLAMLSVTTCSSGTIAGMSLSDVLSDAQRHTRSDHYRLPTQNESLAFESLFTDLLNTPASGIPPVPPDLDRRARELGFTIQVTSGADADGAVLVVREMETQRNGAGIYFIRTGAPPMRTAVIECPHARSDAFTGKLGLEAFLQGSASAFFCSTMRRNTPVRQLPADPADPEGSPSGEDTDHSTGDAASADEDTSESGTDGRTEPVFTEADPAHNPISFFQSAHKSWMRRHPATLVIQLHGFKSPGDGDPERRFDLIIGNGLKPGSPSPFMAESERILRSCYPTAKIGVSGRDTPAYGALTNVQGGYVNRFSAGTFLHIEMERAFRDRLMSEPRLAHEFSTCINRLIVAYETL